MGVDTFETIEEKRQQMKFREGLCNYEFSLLNFLVMKNEIAHSVHCLILFVCFS